MSENHTNIKSAIISIIDDDVGFSQSLAATLTKVGYSVQVFTSANAFLEQPLPTQPSTVLIDFLLPGMTGLELCREINARNLPCTFSVITGHADVPSAVEAIQLGAVDLLEKPFGMHRLLEVVSKALSLAQTRVSNRMIEASVFELIESLTPRERQILDDIANGFVTKQIAQRLAISTRTVDVHRSRIKQKLGIESPLQLANVLAALKSKQA